jgi:hypothetical protein
MNESNRMAQEKIRVYYMSALKMQKIVCLHHGPEGIVNGTYKSRSLSKLLEWRRCVAVNSSIVVILQRERRGREKSCNCSWSLIQ